MMLSKGTRVYVDDKELLGCYKIDMDIINNEIEIQAFAEDIKKIEIDKHSLIRLDVHGEEFYFIVEKVNVLFEPDELVMIKIKGNKN